MVEFNAAGCGVGGAIGAWAGGFPGAAIGCAIGGFVIPLPGCGGGGTKGSGNAGRVDGGPQDDAGTTEPDPTPTPPQPAPISYIRVGRGEDVETLDEAKALISNDNTYILVDNTSAMGNVDFTGVPYTVKIFCRGNDNLLIGEPAGGDIIKVRDGQLAIEGCNVHGLAKQADAKVTGLSVSGSSAYAFVFKNSIDNVDTGISGNGASLPYSPYHRVDVHGALNRFTQIHGKAIEGHNVRHTELFPAFYDGVDAQVESIIYFDANSVALFKGGVAFTITAANGIVCTSEDCVWKGGALAGNNISEFVVYAQTGLGEHGAWFAPGNAITDTLFAENSSGENGVIYAASTGRLTVGNNLTAYNQGPMYQVALLDQRDGAKDGEHPTSFVKNVSVNDDAQFHVGFGENVEDPSGEAFVVGLNAVRSSSGMPEEVVSDLPNFPDIDLQLPAVTNGARTIVRDADGKITFNATAYIGNPELCTLTVGLDDTDGPSVGPYCSLDHLRALSLGCQIYSDINPDPTCDMQRVATSLNLDVNGPITPETDEQVQWAQEESNMIFGPLRELLAEEEAAQNETPDGGTPADGGE
jgi:hypothetical protein